MNIIKLDAIDSTNLYLKDYSRKMEIQNFTTVVAEHQTNGRGQIGSTWTSEIGKNLTFSIFIKNKIKTPNEIFDLNCIITTAIVSVLQKYNLPDLYIKWPNDILSANKKIGGILIENSFKANGEIHSIIGIGLNVNQLNFENAPKASSICLLTNLELDKNSILIDILEKIELYFEKYTLEGSSFFWTDFHDKLYKINEITLFIKNDNLQEFVGTIKKVTKNGLLEIQIPNGELLHFGIKEISMVY